jgi:hypothetical protein
LPKELPEKYIFPNLVKCLVFGYHSVNLFQEPMHQLRQSVMIWISRTIVI